MTKLKISPPPFPNREEYPFTATVRYRGMVIDVENLDGSVREGTDPNGRAWKTEFKGCHYGELRGSLGTDGDKLDVYIKSNPNNGTNKAYIVHQNHPRTHPTKAGQYDEDKIVLGVSSIEDAKKLYLQHYNRKDFLRSVTEMPIEKFKRVAFGENKGEKVARAKKVGRPSSAFIRMKLREGGGPVNIEKIKEAARGKDPDQQAALAKGRSKLMAAYPGKSPGEALRAEKEQDKIKAAACKAHSNPGEGRGHGPTGKPLKDKGMAGKEKDMSKKSEVTEAYKLGAQAALDEYLKEAAQKGFMTVLKKVPGSPPVKGKIPPAPKVKMPKMAQDAPSANVLNPGGGFAPLAVRGGPQEVMTQAVAGPESTPTGMDAMMGMNVASPTPMTFPAATTTPSPVTGAGAQGSPMMASASGVPQIPRG